MLLSLYTAEYPKVRTNLIYELNNPYVHHEALVHRFSLSAPLQKFVAESILFDMDCTPNLASDETITGTPVMSFLPALTGADALVFGAPLVNTVAITYPDGLVGKIGGVVQVRISGGTVETIFSLRTYTVLATFTTSSGNTLVARMGLSVSLPG